MSSATQKRLLKEWKQLNSSMIDENVLKLEPKEDYNLYEWIGLLRGPLNSPYESGQFELSIQIPPAYPHSPPTVKFLTPICHPNIHFKVDFLSRKRNDRSSNP
jgi:peroxin-4